MICSVLILAAPSGRVLAAGDDNFIVNTTNDTNDNDFADGLCSDVSGNCSLRAAIQQAVQHPGSDDTIEVPAGTYNLIETGGDSGSPSTRDDYANNAGVGDFDLYFSSSTLTITGAGSGSTIINASGLSDRVFDVITGSTVTIIGVTIQNGSTSGSGGGIKCAGSSLTLTDVILSNNTASATAGALSTSDCSLTLSNTTFDQNTAVSDGGAAFISISTGNTISITDSEFTNNTSNRLGGAIEFNQVSGSQFATLNRVTFSGNSSTGGGTTGGGALEVYARVHITNGTFIDNSSDTVGGAIDMPDNAAAIMVIANSTIVQNTAGTRGGGTTGGGATASTNLQIKGTIIAANTANTLGPDCYAIYGFNTQDYNFVGDRDDCDFSAAAHDDNTTGARSYMATVALADNGGSIQTLNMWGAETLDIIPPASCTDAAGAALTIDARGMERPQNTNCDRGSYEKNQTGPVVNITSGVDTVECAIGTWTNAGATVTDDVSTGLTASVTSGSVDVNTVGTYPIVYTSTQDGDGNTGTNTRTVTVRDTTAPTIEVTGSDQTITVGDTYTDAGATATDACGGSLTSSIVVTNPVDTTTPGEYTVTYAVSDNAENAATEATRTVVVEPAATASEQISDPVVSTNGKYLFVNVDGVEVDRMQVNAKKVKPKYSVLRKKQVYNKYKSIVLLTVGKTKAKVTVARLTANNQLKKKVTKMFAIQGRSNATLKVKKKSKRIIVSVGNKKNQVKKIYRLGRGGKLKVISIVH